MEGNKVLSKKISSKIKITMVHGSKDEVVQLYFQEKFYRFLKAKKKLVIINNGDHSLSNPKFLKRIIRELDRIIIDII